MKRFLLFTALSLLVLIQAFSQNKTNLRAINAGGKVSNDLNNNTWQYSIGEVFVAPIIGDSVITQGLNQPTIIIDLELGVYVDKLLNENEVLNNQKEDVVIGVATEITDINRDFVIQNKGFLGNLIVDSIVFRYNYFEVDQLSFSIPSLASEAINISLLENTPGNYLDSVYVYSNALRNSPFVFPVYAELTEDAVPEIELFLKDLSGDPLTSGEDISFGTLEVKNDSTQQIVIFNKGLGDLTITDVFTNEAAFQVAGFSPQTLQSEKNLSFAVTLLGNNYGQFSGDLFVVSNDPIYDTIQINLEGIIKNTTTWNGNAWSNGVPDSTINAHLIADYSMAESGGFTAKGIEINAGTTFELNDNTSVIEVKNDIVNNGALSKWCLNPSALETKIIGNPLDVIQPEIFTKSLLEASMEESYSATFSVTQLDAANWKITGAPLGLNPNENILSGSPVELGVFKLLVEASQNTCSVSDSFNIEILGLDNPFLYIPKKFTINCNTPEFPLSVYSDSKGKLTYTVTGGNSCISLDEKSGELEITCPDVEEEITVSIRQERTKKYRASEVSTSISFVKEVPYMLFPQTTFDILSKDSIIPVNTNSSAPPEFRLLGDFSNKLSLEKSGKMELLETGSVPVLVDLPESACHVRVRDTLLIEITKDPKPPIAKTDSIKIFLYQGNANIYVLANDLGVTAMLDSLSVDLRPEDEDIDLVLYLSGVGYFRVVNEESPGLVVFEPDETFLGTQVVPYSIRDKERQIGTGYIVVTVVLKDEIPELEYRELYTPNGDGKNDIFIIGYLNTEAPGNLTVIDRLGNPIFYRERYRNDWDFTLDNGSVVDDGAYFFVYEESGRDKLQGTFEIKRK